ncbi:hypothetical protein ZOSMA_35G00360 [Zostera marina]|uniref:DUF7086 domain-containing protein n=1 Tax=Zostera marina TaxID=29655 RepID=A0A0K9P6D5_ZOSMR|nr:hypothetical protein ZOSMA_35G00360 [Zostera marina]
MKRSFEKTGAMAIEEDEVLHSEIDLELSLSLPYYRNLTPSSSFRRVPSPRLSTELSLSLSLSPPCSHGIINQRVETSLQIFCPQSVKLVAIPPPFPWSSENRATLLTMEELARRGFNTIEGEVQCKRCNVRAVASLQLKERFEVVIHNLLDILKIGNTSAPSKWVNPQFPSCPSCKNVNCMAPIISEKKRNINWLFLYLGETIGMCNLDQLYYFYKHNMFRITGSKIHLLLYTYIGISKQLFPSLVNI